MEKNYKEYLDYMKKVTDGFIDIYTVNHDNEPDRTKIFYEIVWTGGLEYQINQESTFLNWRDWDELKKQNANTAWKYLQDNSMSYDQWFAKYKPSHNAILDKDVERWKAIRSQLTIELDVCNCQRKLKSIITVLSNIHEKITTGNLGFTNEEFLICAFLERKGLVTVNKILDNLVQD